MAWDDSYYFGMCKLVCKASKSTDRGRTVVIKSKTTGKTYSNVISAVTGEVVFLLPPRDSYSISLIEDQETIWSDSIVADYGQYKEITVGYDINDWQGIKDMVDSGDTSSYEVGQQFSVKINGVDVLFDILDKNVNSGVNLIFGMHDCLPDLTRMHSSKSNVGGFDSSELCDWLNDEFYNSLPAGVKSVISDYTWTGSSGGSSPSTQTETHKIWLPTERNVFGVRTYSFAGEYDASYQMAYFITQANRIKKSQTGAIVNWWTSSARTGASNQQYVFCKTTGVVAGGYASNKAGVAPCFMIAKATV